MQGASSTPPLPRNTKVIIITKFGGPKCKEMKTRAKSTKKVNAQGTKFESPNLKGMETRAKSTKIVNAQVFECARFLMRRVLQAPPCLGTL